VYGISVSEDIRIQMHYPDKRSDWVTFQIFDPPNLINLL
jgi:hypothetical protein